MPGDRRLPDRRGANHPRLPATGAPRHSHRRPVWGGGTHGEPRLLAACYENSLALARAHGLRSVAFPAISTGVYGYPVEQAAKVAAATVAPYARGDAFDLILFVGFSAAATRIYAKAIEEAR